MGKNRNQTSTSTTTPDASTQSWIDRYRQIASDAYQRSQNPSAPLSQAGDAYSALAGNIPAGMERGLGGIEQYYNPYESQVVSGVQSDYDRQRGLASASAADAATKAGAFGGSRSAVLQAGLLGDVNREEAARLAQIRQAGFDTATSNLMADRNRAAGLGLAGAQGLLGYGQYLDTRQNQGLDAILQGLRMGGTTTSSRVQLPYNDFQDLLGLGIKAGGLFLGGPAGAAAPAGLSGGM